MFKLMKLWFYIIVYHFANGIQIQFDQTIFSYINATIRFQSNSTRITQFHIDLLHDINVINEIYLKDNFNSDNYVKNYTNITFYNKMIKSHLIQGDLLLKTKNGSVLNIDNILLHFVNTSGTPYLYYPYSLLCFPFKHINNNKFSIINYLKSHNIIKSRSFGFVYNKTTYKYDFFIGEIPSYLKFNQSITKFPVNKNSKAWTLPLWKVSLKHPQLNYSEIYINKYETYLNSYDEFIYAPTDFMDYLFKNVFIKIRCYPTINYNRKYEYSINCYNNYYANFPVIQFHIGKYIFNFSSYDLLKEISPYLFSLTIRGNIYDNGKSFILGRNIFVKKSIEFNYDNQDITFYTNVPFDIDDSYVINDNFVLKHLYICIINMLSPFIILFIIYKLKT